MSFPVFRSVLPVHFIAVLLTGVLLSTGCQPEQAEVTEQHTTMKALATAYGQYISQHRGRPPKNEKSFRKYLESDAAEFLSNFGVEAVDDLFISPRDNEPYEIVYGKMAKIIAYEKVGVDGKRLIADDLGVVEEVDEAKFAELVPNAK